MITEGACFVREGLENLRDTYRFGCVVLSQFRNSLQVYWNEKTNKVHKRYYLLIYFNFVGEHEGSSQGICLVAFLPWSLCVFYLVLWSNLQLLVKGLMYIFFVLSIDFIFMALILIFICLLLMSLFWGWLGLNVLVWVLIKFSFESCW